MDALEAQLILARTPGLQAEHLRAALAQHGAAVALIGPNAALSALNLPAAALTWLRAPDRALIDRDRRWLEREHVVLLDCLSASYPPLLGQLSAAPAFLYVQGALSSLSEPQLAMIGSHSPTEQGHRAASEFAHYFARAGLTITSAVSVGVSAASLGGALAGGGHAVGVLECSVEQLERPVAELARRVAASGALVWASSPAAPAPEGSPAQRDYLISGLSLGTLVIEASSRSPLLRCATLAAEQGREVFALPGSIHNPLSRGPHALIRQGAKLVECAQDVLSEIHIPLAIQAFTQDSQPAVEATKRAPVLDKDYEILLDALRFEPVSVDTLISQTGLPSQSIASMLLILELEGRVKLHADRRYVHLKQRQAT